MATVLELSGVAFATLVLLLVAFYYTLLPTFLNITLSVLGAWYLQFRLESRLASVLGFLLISLTLTFGSRLPDLIADSFRGLGSTMQLGVPHSLVPGDTVVLAERYGEITHRGSYYSTPGYESNGQAAHIGAPKFYAEDILQHLMRRGIRVQFGPPAADMPYLTFERGVDAGRQQIMLEISLNGEPTGRYLQTERLSFSDETWQSTFGMHVQHLFKNSLWNWFARILERPSGRPIESFLDAMLPVNRARPAVETALVTPAVKTVELAGLDLRPFVETALIEFDCNRESGAGLSTSKLSTRVFAEDYQLNIDWPAPETHPNQRRGDYRTLRISCGKHGYVAWLNGHSPWQRLVLTDRLWQPLAALDFEVPELTRDDQSWVYSINLVQKGQQLFIEALVADRTSKPHRHKVVTLRLEHAFLTNDFGRGASVFPGFDLFDQWGRSKTD